MSDCVPVIKPAALNGTAGQTLISIKIQTASGTNTGTKISAAWLGEGAATGNLCNFDGHQVQLTVSGSTTIAVHGAVTITFDAASFNYDPTKDLVLALDFANGSPPPPPQCTCLPIVPYPGQANGKDVDSSAVHTSIVSLMNTPLVANTASGCPPVPDISHGINGPNVQSESPKIAAILKSANQKTLRYGLWRDGIFNVNGSLNLSGLSQLDTSVAWASGNGFTQIVVISASSKDPFTYSTQAASFQAYATAMVNMIHRYPGIVYWELDNEVDACAPNNCSTTLYGDYNGLSHYQQGQNYAKMLSIVVPAMRAANPNIKVVLGGLGGIDTTPTSWSQALVDSNAIQYIDVWNIHVYGAIAYRVLDEGIYYRTFLSANGQAKMPMFLTEWGDNTSNQLANETAAYADLQKYCLYARDTVYSFNSPDGYGLFFPQSGKFLSVTPNATEQYFMSHP